MPEEEEMVVAAEPERLDKLQKIIDAIAEKELVPCEKGCEELLCKDCLPWHKPCVYTEDIPGVCPHCTGNVMVQCVGSQPDGIKIVQREEMPMMPIVALQRG